MSTDAQPQPIDWRLRREAELRAEAEAPRRVGPAPGATREVLKAGSADPPLGWYGGAHFTQERF